MNSPSIFLNFLKIQDLGWRSNDQNGEGFDSNLLVYVEFFELRRLKICVGVFHFK